MSDFPVQELAALLHPQELEILEEISYELEDTGVDLTLLLKALARPSNITPPSPPPTRSRPAYHVPTNSKSFFRMLKEADKATASGKPYPGVIYLAQAGNAPKVTDAPVEEVDEAEEITLSPTERERYEELKEELKELAKQGRRLPAVLTRDEVRLLLEVSQEHERDHLIIRLFYATGCRRSEIENMTVADIDFKARQIFVRDGKWNKDRYVFIDPVTADKLARFTYAHALSSPIFDIQDRQINRRVQRWAKKAGLTKRYLAQGRHISSHCLRHAFATHLHEAGMDLFVLRDLLGHRFLSTTRLYVHVAIARFQSDYDTFHPLGGENFLPEV